MLSRASAQHKLSEAQKGRILSLYNDSNWSVSAICQTINCCPKTVRRWINRFESVGNVVRIKQTGRPKCTTVQQDQDLVRSMLDEPFSFVTQVAREKQLSYKTALNRLKQVGLKRRRAVKRQVLTDAVRRKRIEFAQLMLRHKEWWEWIIFTDEKSFCTNESSVKYVYRPKGHRFNEKYIAPSHFSGRKSASYWGWISSKGLGEITATNTRFNSAKYIELLENFAIPSITTEFAPLNHCIFQQDNSQVHNSRLSFAFLRSAGFRFILNWPSHSPDINLIENIWAIMELKRKNVFPRSLEELDKLVHDVWEELRLDTQICEKLYDSLEKRFEYIINHNGFEKS